MNVALLFKANIGGGIDIEIIFLTLRSFATPLQLGNPQYYRCSRSARRFKVIFLRKIVQSFSYWLQSTPLTMLPFWLLPPTLPPGSTISL